MSHTADTTTPARDRWAAISPTFRVFGLVATLVLIAALEVGAGKAAGWGNLAYGVPAAVDPFVLGVLLSPRARLADRLFALGLVESTVVISAVWGAHEAGANVLIGSALATLLVAALWRQDETIRRERGHGDLLAEATARAVAAERRARELEASTAEAVRQEKGNAEAAKERALTFERRAIAAEAKAAELDRLHRDTRDDRPRVPRTVKATAPDDAAKRRRDAIRGLVEAGNPNPSKRDALAAFAEAGVGPGDNAKIVPLIAEVLTEIAAERATAAGHPNLYPLPAANG